MRSLTPRVYGILKYGSLLNAYLIRNGKDLTLVDTGIAGFSSAIEQALTNIGATWSDIKVIFLTHAHIDHAGDLAAVQKKVNAMTLTHRLDAPIARGEAPVQRPDPSTLSFVTRIMSQRMANNTFAPSRIDRELNGGEVLDEIAPGATVIHLPGHTFGQSGLWLPDEGTLIGGDMAANLPLQGLRMPFRAPTADWVEAQRTIQKVAQMDIKNLMMGHGAPLLGDAKAQLSALAARLPNG